MTILPQFISPLFSLLPFLGVLLSLATGPLLLPALWHKLEKKILLFFSAVSIIVIFLLFTPEKSSHDIMHTLWLEYIPFMSVAYVLYTISSGVHIQINQPHLPLINVMFILIAASSASIIGTTGASMLFIRPLLLLNKHRIHKTHLIIFFIIIVSNIAGSLTPLGDPPLFLGYLRGVPFSWPALHLIKPFLFVISTIMAIFYIIDKYLYKKEPPLDLQEKSSFFKSWQINGKPNLALMAFVIVFTGTYKNIPSLIIGSIANVSFLINDILFITIMIGIGTLSHRITHKDIHHKNQFSLGPIKEIGFVFFAIFITLIPVNHMLSLGLEGPFSKILQTLQKENPQILYFWLTGFFSSFLDNAPTYLVFIKLAGDDIAQLTSTHSSILAAISLGAVYMGAITYIGNAPNFMVLKIAKQHCVPMPNFLVYTIIVSSILIPIFIVMSYICL